MQSLLLSRRRLTLLFLLSVCALVSASAVAAEPKEPLPDPLPIRRILLPADRLPAELERVRQGMLVQRARADFEAQLQRAQQAAETLKNPPRLVESRYRAVLTETDLTGSGQWKVVNPTGGTGVLALPALNLALQKIRTQKVAQAVLGDLDGKTLGLLVEEGGEASFFLDWSARGTPFPGGLRFDVRVPASAIATFELDVPVGRVVSTGAPLLLAGPLPAESADRSRWRVDFAGRSQLDLVVRNDKSTDPSPLLLSRLHTRLDLGPDRLQAVFDFDLEALHPGVRELFFDCDPALEPFDVGVRNLESWELKPAANPAQSSTLSVKLREPLQGSALRLQIRCLGKLEKEKTWSCPSLWARGAVPRGETLVLRIHPEVHLENWQSGTFHFVATGDEAAPAAPAGKTKPAGSGDGWQVLTLADHGLHAGSAPVRPSARLKSLTPDFLAFQAAWWQVDARSSTLTSQLTFEMMRGQLFRLACAVPDGWEIDRIEMKPAELLRGWNALREKNRTLLVVDLQRPLVPPVMGKPAPTPPPRLTVWLHPARSWSIAPAGTQVPFPILVPLGARIQEGILGVSIDPVFQVKAPVPAEPPAKMEEGPWGNRALDLLYPFRGTPITGSIHLHPRRAQVSARCDSDVALAPERASVTTQLLLKPRVGATDVVDLTFSAPTAGEWSWQVERGNNQVRSLQRLPAAEQAPRLCAWLGARQPLAAASLLAVPLPQGQCWRMKLARPLHEPLLLQTAQTFLIPVDKNVRPPFWNVPLARVAAADPMDGEVTVHLDGVEDSGFSAYGLGEASDTTPGRFPARWRAFHYGSAPSTLVLASRRSVAPTPAREAQHLVIERACLIATVHSEGRLVHDYHVWVRDRQQRSLPVRLPAGARCLAVKADERWLSELEPVVLHDAVVVELPIPAGTALHHLEIVYETAAPAWTLWSSVESPAPQLPVRAGSFRRLWRLPAGVIPMFRERFDRSSPVRTARESRSTDVRADPFASAGDEEKQWVEWEPLAGFEDRETIEVIRHDLIPSAGIALAIFLASIAWPARRWSRWLRLGVLASWLIGGGVALERLPESLHVLAWYPLLLLACVTMLGLFLSGARRRPAALIASALLALTLSQGTFGQIAAPAPVSVYYVPGAGDDPAKQTVLVPPALLEQLQDIIQRGVAGPRPPVLLSADYEGNVVEDRADFEARLRVYCFAGEAASLHVPLGGVQLKEALCDGAPAHLVAVRAAREGYAVAVKGQGMHEIVCRFRVPLTVAGAERGVRFAIPELPQSRLVLNVPAGVRYLSSVAGRGSQTVTPALKPGAPADKALRLEADLGRVSALNARWSQEGSRAPLAAVQVHELYLWKLRPAASTLQAILHYTVRQGATSALWLQVPAELDVLNVEANRLPEVGTNELLPRLKDWQLTGKDKQRRLGLEFQQPLTGGAQVVLELVPRQTFGPAAVLPLPVPLDVATTEGLLAYQVEGVRSQVAQHLRINGMDPKVFAKEWKAAGMTDPGPQIHAYSFHRTSGGSPFLQLDLSLAGSDIECVQNVTWALGQQQAGVVIQARLHAPAQELFLVEWEVPESVANLELTGPDVRNWSRSGTRIQVWLERPLRATELKLTGRQSLAKAQELKKQVKSTVAAPASVFHLMPLPILNVRSQTAFVRVAAETGLALGPEGVKNLWPLPETRLSDREHGYVTDRSDYGGSFVIRRAAATTDVRLLSHVELLKRGLAFNADLVCRTTGNEPSNLVVRLRNWRGTEVRLETPTGMRVREGPRTATDRSWLVTLPASQAQDMRLKILGTIPLETSSGVLMPDVQVEGAARVERWVAVLGRELKAEEPRGLTAVRDLAQTLSFWPGEAGRIDRAGAAWKVGVDDWQLRLLPASPVAAAAPPRILLADHAAAVGTGRRWRHQAVYWLYQETNAGLGIVLPDGAEIVTATVDQAEVVPLQRESGRVWLPRAGSEGATTLRLSWMFPAGKESFDQPRLQAPLLEGALSGPAQWTINVPVGYSLSSRDDQAAAGGPAEPVLRRAEAQLQLSALLAARKDSATPGSAGHLATSQEMFYHFCREAEDLRALAALPAGRVQELHEQNLRLAKQLGFEKTRAQAERHAHTQPATSDHATPDRSKTAALAALERTSPLLPERSTPTYWTAAGANPAPIVQLSSQSAQQRRREREQFLLLSALLLAAGIWFLFPRMLKWRRGGGEAKNG